MMLGSKWAALAALPSLVTWTGEARLTFVNPSPAGVNKDYSADPVYTIGQSVTVSWSGSETGVPVTLALLQQTLEEETDTSQEVLVDASIAGKTQYVWVVATTKNLAASNVFFLDLFANQSLSPDSTSHYFNISARSDDASSTGSSAPASSLATAPPSAATTGLATSTTGRATSSLSPAPAPGAATSSPPAAGSAPGRLSTGSKIGLGVGLAVPLSLALGALAGWCLYRRKLARKAVGVGTATPGEAAGALLQAESKYSPASPVGGSQQVPHELHNNQALASHPPGGEGVQGSSSLAPPAQLDSVPVRAHIVPPYRLAHELQ